MIDISETGAGVKRFRALMRSAHSLRIVVQLVTLDGAYKKDLSGLFLEGQVTVDTTADTTRALEITICDPLGEVDIEADSPARSSIYLADLIRVWYVITNPTTSESFTVPVFTGPVDGVSRDGIFLDIKAIGKESLGLGNTWQGKSFAKGQRKTDVITWILVNLMGESPSKVDVPSKNAKLPRALKVTPNDQPWRVATRLAGSMNMQLFYDGRGVARLRARSTKPVHVVDETWATSDAQMDSDLSGVINAVKVIGSKPKKAKEKVRYTAVATKTHPLSPWRLGRNGIPRYIWTSIEDDSLRTVAECKALADSVLRNGLVAGVTFTVDGIMDPRLEELDCVKVAVGDIVAQGAIRSYTIPLTAGDDGSYGYVRRIRPKGGMKMIKRKKHKVKHKNHKGNKGKHGADGKN